MYALPPIPSDWGKPYSSGAKKRRHQDRRSWPSEPASSGKVVRHRLNPGGNRDANRALHVVALNRLRRDPRTQGYLVRRTSEGKSKKEAMRCLKRYIARETYRAILLDAGARVPPG